MINMRSIVLLVCVGFLLTACGPQQVALKPETIQSIHHITIVEPDKIEVYTANDWGNLAGLFGGLGGAAVGMSTKNKTERLNKILTDGGLDFSQKLALRLIDKLKNQNYEVATIAVKRPQKGKLLESYPDVPGTDALLDISIVTVGYATEHPMTSPHWRPSAELIVALVQADTMKTLYKEKIMLGYHNPFMSATDIDAPEKYNCKNAEELFADESRIMESMNTCVDIVSEHIANVLSGKPRG